MATLYQSAPHKREFYWRASAVAKQLAGDEYETILVNDGSPDDSLDNAVQLYESDTNVVVDLSRNFGHHRAVMTGLAHAKGDRIFSIDSDLEEKPEWLLEYEKRMVAEDSDVVQGDQSSRKGNLFEKGAGKIYYRLLKLFTGIEQPSNFVTARFMSLRYIEGLLAHQELEINIGGLWVPTGFKQGSHIQQKHSSSPVSYSLSLELSHLVNVVTSISSYPLVFTFYFGLLISGPALVYIAHLTVRHFFIESFPDGYTTLITSIGFFSGLIIFFVGVQGI